MAKYHVSPDGSGRPCKAQAGSCPYGSNAPHFANLMEAQAEIADAYQHVFQEVKSSVVVTPSPLFTKIRLMPQYWHNSGQGLKGEDASPLPKAGDRVKGKLVASALATKAGTKIIFADGSESSFPREDPLEYFTPVSVPDPLEQTRSTTSVMVEEALRGYKNKVDITARDLKECLRHEVNPKGALHAHAKAKSDEKVYNLLLDAVVFNRINNSGDRYPYANAKLFAKKRRDELHALGRSNPGQLSPEDLGELRALNHFLEHQRIG